MVLRTIIKNTFFQTLTRVISSGIAFLVTILIARNYPVTTYGDFTKIISFVSLYYLFIDFGLNALFIQREHTLSHFRSLLSIRLLFALCFFVLAASIAFLLPFNPSQDIGFSPLVRLGIVVYALSFFSQAVLLSTTAVFQKRLAYEYLAVATVVGSLVTIVFVGIGVFSHVPLPFLLLAMVLGSVSAAFSALLLTRLSVIPLSVQWQFTKELLVESWPLGGMLLFNLIYFRVDMILLSFLRPTAEVGVYGLAYRFFDFLIALPLFLSNALYPYFIAARKKYTNTSFSTGKYLALFTLLSLPVMFFFWVFSPLIILVKSDYVSAILPFRVLLLSLPFFFATNILQWLLIVAGQQRYLLKVYATLAVINVVLNGMLIPTYSYLASAVITGVCEGVVFFFLLWKIRAIKKT